jgi:hypothetical protein
MSGEAEDWRARAEAAEKRIEELLAAMVKLSNETPLASELKRMQERIAAQVAEREELWTTIGALRMCLKRIMASVPQRHADGASWKCPRCSSEWPDGRAPSHQAGCVYKEAEDVLRRTEPPQATGRR